MLQLMNVMKKIFLIIFILSSICYSADTKSESVLVNQVLFEIKSEAYTTYDFKNYLKLKKELKIGLLLPLVQNELQEFILYRLSILEVLNLDFQPTESELKQTSNKDHRIFLQVQKFLKQKEKHIGQIERYKSWTDVLKRKYNYLAKTDELRGN